MRMGLITGDREVRAETAGDVDDAEDDNDDARMLPDAKENAAVEEEIMLEVGEERLRYPKGSVGR